MPAVKVREDVVREFFPQTVHNCFDWNGDGLCVLGDFNLHVGGHAGLDAFVLRHHFDDGFKSHYVTTCRLNALGGHAQHASRDRPILVRL